MDSLTVAPRHRCDVEHAALRPLAGDAPDIVDWCLGPGIACRGSRLLATEANGQPAFAQYKPSPDGGYEPWSIQVLELSGDRIAGITFFLDTARFFPLFGFPLTLEDELHR